MRNYKISNKGLAELCSYEAWASKPYLDSGGVKTWLFGATDSDIKKLSSVPWTQEETIEFGIEMLRKHVQKYVDAVNSELDVDITQEQFDALVSITYNIGTGNTKNDTGGMAGSTFMKRVNAKATASSVVSAMAAWNKDNGRVIQGLVNRRKKEGELYQYGKYTSDWKCARIVANPTSHKPSYSGTVNLKPYLADGAPAVLDKPVEPVLQSKEQIIEQPKSSIWEAIFNVIRALIGK